MMMMASYGSCKDLVIFRPERKRNKDHHHHHHHQHHHHHHFIELNHLKRNFLIIKGNNNCGNELCAGTQGVWSSSHLNYIYQHLHLHWRRCFHTSFIQNSTITTTTATIKPFFELLTIFGILLSLSSLVICEDLKDFQRNIPARLVWAAVGKNVDLQCDLTPPTPKDSVKLLLWFKDATGIPLYSLDSRGGNIRLAPHSAIASDLGQRLFFSIGDNPRNSYLQIRDVKPTDGGIYRCRVDYFNFPSRNYRINLTLIVPSEEPRIFDAQGKEINEIAGPFREGYELFLCCQVKGGRPAPKVTWWKDDIELMGTSHTTNDDGILVIVNQLLISSTPREFFATKIQCRSQNSKLVEPVIKEVTIQVYLKPIWIKIVTPNELLTAGNIVPLSCETWGSYPTAKILWFLQGETIRDDQESIQSYKQDLNVTVSTLMFRVTAENDNSELSCRASNPWFTGSVIEDKRIIFVSYAPTVSVQLANENQTNYVVRSEKENVTFKCLADGRPPVTSYSWFKNGMRMSGENGHILHLNRLERESSGAYACGAINTEGETRSLTITLKVQFSPRCKPGTEQTFIGAINLHSIPIKCEVEADPAEAVKFSWTYNNTRNVSPVLNSRIQSNGLRSTVTFIPQTDSELITLACWASNVIGRQTVPCLIHLVPANPPESPKGCELRNDTDIEVNCLPGNDGGLTQYFVLEVIDYSSMATNLLNTIEIDTTTNNEIATMSDEATSAPLFRLKGSKPQFRIKNLDPGREYQFLIYAINAKGRSYPPLVIGGVRVNPQSRLYDDFFLSEDPTPAGTTYHISSNPEISDIRSTLSVTHERQFTLLILVAIIVISAVIVTSTIIAGIVIICKQQQHQQQQQQHQQHPSSASEAQNASKDARIARNNISSMYVEDDTLHEDDLIMCNRIINMRPYAYSSPIRSQHTTSTLSNQRIEISDGYIQYAQPSLNDPDLILPRGELEFTTLEPMLK